MASLHPSTNAHNNKFWVKFLTCSHITMFIGLSLSIYLSISLYLSLSLCLSLSLSLSYTHTPKQNISCYIVVTKPVNMYLCLIPLIPSITRFHTLPPPHNLNLKVHSDRLFEPQLGSSRLLFDINIELSTLSSLQFEFLL